MLMTDNSLFIPVENPNMAPRRTANAKLPMEQRLSSFDEIEATYTQEEALIEANSCLKCPPTGANGPALLEFLSRTSLPKFGNRTTRALMS